MPDITQEEYDRLKAIVDRAIDDTARSYVRSAAEGADSVDAAIAGALKEAQSQILRYIGDSEDHASTFYEGDKFVPYSDNPERHVYQTGAIKDNKSKPRVDLLPSLPLLEISKVLAYGAQKYKPHNWRYGLPWGDTFASLQRHLLAWNDREDIDRETGISHLAHAGCQLLFLLEYALTGTGTDDRYTPDPKR